MQRHHIKPRILRKLAGQGPKLPLRVLRFHRTEASADALAICASKLGYYAHNLSKSDKPEHQKWVERFEQLRSMCLQAMEQQAKTKWMTPERMGL